MSENKKTIVGLLWIFSGPIFILLAIIMGFLLNFVLGVGPGTVKSFINILLWGFGLVGIILVIAGPIIGVIYIAKK